MPRALRRSHRPPPVAFFIAAAVASPAVAQDAVRGAGLYLQLPAAASCVACHGPDLLANRNGFLRAADRPEVLQRALNTVSAMGYLQPHLGVQEVADLAAFLGRVLPLAAGTAALEAWPLVLDFGSVVPGAVSPVQTVALRNRGGTPLPLAVQPQGDGFLLAHDCPSTLPAGARCSLSLRWQPPQAGPGRTGVVAVTNPATAQPVLVAMVGRAPAAAGAVLHWQGEPGGLDFGTVPAGEVRTRTLQLLNAGSAPAVLGTTTVIGPQSPRFATAGCATGTVLAPGLGCAMTVTHTGGGQAADAVLQTRSDGANPAALALSAAAPPAPAPSAPAPALPADDGGGGGAASGAWLVLLLWAVLALTSRSNRRRPS
ncbi:choice-of-anchor D domain-containing protein [Aquabacterium sp. J223]|uniref:choice-of-anchor D domain-containing protein n=1 Tax=Aquabacterium sp. J223 TaxID=2898431 RepID=UPI0021ADEFDE|nr:choice-of-anchor D domain-containing protein [Aquabacterium sp. J223]UUX95514.1 choice-of-anchor D domain-containing protein [Aquabacterium sp. J223]